MGSRGTGGERVSRQPVDPSKCAHRTQLVSSPLLMSERAANLVSKVPYFGDELCDDKRLSLLELSVEM
jgi:hypothetical protein